MIITYHSATCFKVQFGDTVLAFNPISKKSTAYKPVRFGADISLVSAHHPDCNGVAQTTKNGNEPFVVRGPGEYEVNGVTIRGFDSMTEYGGERRHNTIYIVELEGMILCFLGLLGDHELPHDAWEAIDQIDLLFVPIGGKGALDATHAYKRAVSMEPHVIIPMLYDITDTANGITTFVEEGGKEEPDPVDKLTIKQKDISDKESEIVVLTAQG